MSFIRLNKGKPKNPPRKRKVTKPKPWDDTVSDLDAYKATPEEIAYRKEAHRSKHAISSHLLKGKQRQGKKSSPFKTNAQARKYAIMKEVLYDQKQLQEVLEKSDTMMAVVKDLFGDDPRRFAGFPAVTNAPNSIDDVETSLIRLPGDIKTRSEVLSDSVMDGSALNEFQDSESEEDVSAVPLVYQPKLNMQRFQQFIEAEERNNTLSTISGKAGLSHLGSNVSQQHLQGNAQSSQLPEQSGVLSQGDGSFQTPKANSHNESLEILRPPGSAINDTNKVNKTKRRVPRPEPPGHNTSSNFSLNDLRKVLEILEDEIAEYERVTGRRPPAERQRQESFSGYTLAIVDSVTKLTRYLKESELRLQAEITVREQLTQDVAQFRALVDALTSDIIFTQEEFGRLAVEFQKFRKDTVEEIARLKGEQLPDTSQQNDERQMPAEQPVTTVTPPKSRLVPHNVHQNLNQLPPQFPFGEHLQPASSAVMLSPPVRRSRVTESEKISAAGNNKQSSLMDFPEYLSSPESGSLAVQDDFTELPTLCTTSNANIINQLCAGVQQSLAGRTAHSVSVTSSGRQNVSQTNFNQNSVMPVNTVNVPKPTPLVQSNVSIPLPSDQGQVGHVNSQSMPQSFLEKNQPISIAALREQPNQNQLLQDQGQMSQSSQDSADREYLASQIAALNRQHAEAQKRLQGLMLQKQLACQVSAQEIDENQTQQQVQQRQAQQIQSIQLQQNQGQQMPLSQLQQQHQQQQQQQQNASQDPPSQEQVQSHQLTQGLQKQQLQYLQQQRLIELVHQQQQKLQEQQRWHDQSSQQMSQQMSQRPKPNIPVQQMNGNYTETADHVRQSVDLPGHKPQQKPTGLPDYPISPNISPISRRSENMTAVYKSVDSQDASVTVPASRGIMVSLPQVDMDLSAGSPSPRP